MNPIVQVVVDALLMKQEKQHDRQEYYDNPQSVLTNIDSKDNVITFKTYEGVTYRLTVDRSE